MDRAADLERPNAALPLSGKSKVPVCCTLVASDFFIDLDDSTAMSPLDLTDAEKASLAVVTLQKDFMHVRGDKAPILNKKKLSITRAHWKAIDIESVLPTTRVRLAYHALIAQNRVYAEYVRHHNFLLHENFGRPTSD